MTPGSSPAWRYEQLASVRSCLLSSPRESRGQPRSSDPGRNFSLGLAVGSSPCRIGRTPASADWQSWSETGSTTWVAWGGQVIFLSLTSLVCSMGVITLIWPGAEGEMRSEGENAQKARSAGLAPAVTVGRYGPSAFPPAPSQDWSGAWRVQRGSDLLPDRAFWKQGLCGFPWGRGRGWGGSVEAGPLCRGLSLVCV